MTLYEHVTTNHQASAEEREVILRRIYQQVLERQPYQSERRQLADLETQFVRGKIGIRHFLKSLGVRPIYLRSFYENSSNLKFIENAFKHFLGRSPQNEEEIHVWDELLLRHGVGAMISAMIDSDEYRKAFGYFTVPYWRSTQHESPSGYLENQLLGHEHPGQRGWSVPTLYQHQLQINCEGGVCHPQDRNKPIYNLHTIEGHEEETEIFPSPMDNSKNGQGKNGQGAGMESHRIESHSQTATLSRPELTATEIKQFSQYIDEIAKILYKATPPQEGTTFEDIQQMVWERVLESVDPEVALMLS